MLAKTGDTMLKQEWSGFPHWHALIVQPGRELKAADFLTEKAGALIYLPLYIKQVRLRARVHVAKSFPVIPGLLFAPVSITDLPRRDFAFALAHVHGFRTCDGRATIIGEGEIEKLRQLEAKCNGAAELERRRQALRIGDTVRLNNLLYRSWGQAKVVRIDDSGRIDVEFPNLFGGRLTITVPAVECERMQPFDAIKLRAHRSKPSPAV